MSDSFIILAMKASMISTTSMLGEVVALLGEAVESHLASSLEVAD